MASLFLMVGAVWAQIPATSTAPADGKWNADTKWYTIQCNDNSKGYISLQHADVNGKLMLNKSAEPTGAEGLWCVVGDDANGYQFYNCASGATKVLGATGSDGSGRMKMYDASSTETGVTYKFNIKKLDGQDGYAFVQQYGATNQWWNNRDNYLSYWNNSAAYATDCTGSQYMFVEVTSEDLKTLADAYKTSAINVLTSLEELFDDAKTIKAAIESVNTNDAAALGTIISEFEKIGNKRIAFRNGDPDHSARVNAYLAVRPNREKGYGTQAHQNWGNIVWSLKLGNNSTFALYNEVHELYLGSPSSNGALTAVPTAGYTVELIDAASNKVEFKWGDQTLHLNNHDDGFLSSYDYNDNASRWYIETDLSGRLAEYKTAIAGLIADATALAADTRLEGSEALANLNATIEKVNSGDDLVSVVKTVSELPSLMDAANVYIRETDVTYITALNFTENSNHPIIVNNKRSNWGVAANPTGLSTLHDLGLAKSSIDTKQQFAIITPDNGANYYLYSVHAQRYLKSNNTFSTQGEPIAFADASSKGENKVQVRFRDVAQKYFNVGGSNQMEIDYWDTIDDGNACEIVQYNTLEFDLEHALKVLKEGAQTTVKYMLGEEQVFLQNELLFLGDTKTLSLYGAKIISVTVNGTPLTAPSDNANWKYTVDEVGPKEIIVNYELKTCWFALQSPASPATYFNFTAKTVDGPVTNASFQTTPSYLTITPSDNGYSYVLKNKEDATVAIGSTHNWCVTNSESLWLISEADENGLVTISRKGDANKRLGSNSNTNAGTAIFTNVNANCNKWKIVELFPLTITYKYNDTEVEELKVDTYVAPGTYTIENRAEHDGQVISSCKIGEEEVTGVNGFWTITVNAATEVEVTLVDDVPEETNLYALQSPSGTFFNFTPKVVDSKTTQASFQSTPSFVYKIEENGSYVFQSLEDDTKYIGYDATVVAYWLTTTNKSYWTISEADEDGLVAISRVDAESNGLGSDDNTNVDTGIFTNAGSAEGNVCNRWKLLRAYPLTINYVCNGQTLSTIKDAVIAGASYFAEIDNHGGTLVSCVTDKGIMNVKDGHLSFAKVTAATTITITLEDAMAHGTLEIDNWKVSYEPATNGIKLKGATIIDENGSGDLVIPSTCNIDGKDQKVVAISPDFLHGNTKVTYVKFPASLVNLGFRKVEPMFVGKYEGQAGDGVTDVVDGDKTIKQGTNRCYIFPNDPHTGQPFMVNEKTAWRLTLDVTIDNVTDDFNQFGSAIVSTNANSLADYYTNHMQIYLHDGHKDIVVKMNNSDDRYKYNTYVLDDAGNETSELLANTHFKFELEHDGTGGYQIVIYYENGKAKMYNITADNNIVDFDRLYYSLPEGIHVDVKFDRLVSEGLFVGCTNLQKIEVEPANPTFKSCEHGVLYDKNGYYVMRIPEGVPAAEGEETPHFDIPSKVVKLYAGAVHGVKADIVLHSNPDIGVVEGHDEHVKNAKFYLSLDDIDATITEKETGYGGARDFISTNINTYQSANYKRAPLAKGVYGTICLPFVPTNAMEKYDFFKFKSGDATSLTFSQVTELEANEPYLYKLKENPGAMDMQDGKDVFKSKSGEIVTIETKDKYDPTQHKPGTYHALGSFVNYYVETAKYPNSAFYYYSLGQKKFLKVTQKLTYRPYRAFFVVTPEVGGASQAPARLSLCLLDGTTTDIDASLVEGMETPVYYDLSGRRVLNPGSGVYIVNGKKVFIK